MADLTPKTIGELPEASSLSDSDLFAISSSSAAKRTLWSTIKSAIMSAVSSNFFPLSIANGGTGSATASAAMTALGNADYIVDAGQTTVSGNVWNWRKFASGICEAWATITTGNLSFSTWGSGYYALIPSYDLPTPLFTSVVSLQTTVSGANRDCWLGGSIVSEANPDFTTAHVPNRMALRFTNPSTTQISVSYHVMGRCD